MIRTPQHYLAFFRKRFSFVVLAALAFLFFIISQTNNVFAENKKIVDEIESFLSIQNDAHEAITSGINSLERSCFSDLPDVNSTEEFKKFRMKEFGLNEREWQERYSTVKHLYYDYEDLKEFVEDMGYKYSVIKPSNYLSKHQKFKFDLWIEKI